MQTKTLSERIAELVKWYNTPPKESFGNIMTREAVEIIEEIQAENAALLAKNKELEELSKKEINIGREIQRLNNDLDAEIYILKAKLFALEARNKELEEENKSLSDSAEDDFARIKELEGKMELIKLQINGDEPNLVLIKINSILIQNG